MPSSLDSPPWHSSLSRKLAAFEAGFHYATHVVSADLLVAVLIAQVDFHARDVIAKQVQGTLDHAADLSGQCFSTFDVAVRIDLDLHGALLCKSALP